ncbi:general odorant-binding protein 70 [Toxorhynchites rutilus septentrionalis]|uniref:general odorant-binding protein 70 n=1 Tax=Toxorhynchites rutilus septentrionalis TaxID=329112 RepID=UPI0024788810|nr:general odorant-binding protein 70 [Toxorhynchites rutilus septentrionalis]
MARILIVLCVSFVLSGLPAQAQVTKKRCVSQPNVSKKVNRVIHECQEEIKMNLVEDTIRAYKENWHDRKKRDASELGFPHPTVVSSEDKWIAGCLMQCVYRKNDAIDKNGWPTLDGLVNLYTDGVNEQGYFMATLRGVDRCLKGTSLKYKVKRNDVGGHFEQCGVSFDVFDCISDMITDYCSDQPKHVFT